MCICHQLIDSEFVTLCGLWQEWHYPCFCESVFSVCTIAINGDEAASTVKAKDAAQEWQTKRTRKKKWEAAAGKQLKWTIKEWPWDIQKKGNTEKWSVRTSACSGGLPWSSGYACMHACVCMCLCVYVCVRVFVQASVHLHRLSGLAQWVGSVGWRGALWIPLQANSLSGPAKVSLLPGGVGAGAGGGGDASAWPPGTLCLIATAKALAHTHILLEWTLTPIQRHTIKSW